MKTDFFVYERPQMKLFSFCGHSIVCTSNEKFQTSEEDYDNNDFGIL